MDGFAKFKESKQAAVKLDLALRLAFCRDLPQDQLEVLQSYLRQRIRPAAALCAERQDLELLNLMDSLGWLHGVDLEDCLQQAAQDRNLEAYFWLLERKQRETGFPEPDFSL